MYINDQALLRRGKAPLEKTNLKKKPLVYNMSLLI